MPTKGDTAPNEPRPSIGVLFKCCNVYTRVYLNRLETAFFGHCPRCTRPMTVKIGKGGSKSRFWTAE